jgi:inorganic pyrophosphatase
VAVPDLLTLPHRLDRAAATCRAVIETPKGHRLKLDYEPDSGLFEVKATLPAGMTFPLAFGFVPNTRAEDGDPVDVLVLADDDLPVGCLCTVRLLGVIEADQTEGDDTVRNDRIVARLERSRMHADVSTLEEMGRSFTDELARFFQTYNGLKGGSFAVRRLGSAQDAAALIERSTLPG